MHPHKYYFYRMRVVPNTPENSTIGFEDVCGCCRITMHRVGRFIVHLQKAAWRGRRVER